jgi:signal transduction histidine kinase
MPAIGPATLKLNDLCRLSDVQWAAWLTLEPTGWTIASFSAGVSQRKKLVKWMLKPEINLWLTSAYDGPRPKQRVNPSKKEIAGKSIFLFPVRSIPGNALLLGAEVLTTESKTMWTILAAALGNQLSGDYQKQVHEEAMVELENTQQELRARVAAQEAAESRLIQTTKLAAVGEMAAGVAHELNNPLTTVVGFSELVKDSLPQDAPQHADMDIILKEARRARDVVRRLLDFSRQSETVRVRADLNEIVQDVLSLMQHLFHINGIEIEARFDPALPWVLVDRNQMKQVFLNILNNALNAMPQGGKLSINTSRVIRYGQGYVAVGIQDSGVGISPDNLPRIFEPFFTTRSGQGGTGLGLSVTYGIVTEHGGAIEVESAPERGSTFTVFLPVEDSL